MKKIIIYILIISGFCFACSEEETKTYNAQDFVYFLPWEIDKPNSTLKEYYYDTLTYNFLFYRASDTVLQAPVIIGGEVKNYDRTIYVDYECNGIPGEDHEIIPHEIIVKAGASRTYIPVRIKETRILQDTIFYLTLTLRPNDDFNINYEKIKVDGKVMDRRSTTIAYTAALTPPELWNQKATLIGHYWSRTKFQTINEMFNITLTDWLDPKSSFYVNFETYMIIFGNQLNSKILEGPDAAYKDPENPNINDKGYMTIIGGFFGVPEVKIPADFPNLLAN